MKLLIQSAMIFFGTLMAAGLVALGEPAPSGDSVTSDVTTVQLLTHLLETARPWVQQEPAGRGR